MVSLKAVAQSVSMEGAAACYAISSHFSKRTMKPNFIAFAMVILLMCCALPGTSAATETSNDSMLQTGISGSIFETHGGYVHGFVSVAEAYLDNILYTATDKKGDIVTLISPGLWVSIPGGQEEIPKTTTASSVPGGVVQSSLSGPEFRRLLAYLAYTPEFEFYREYSEENTTIHQLQGSVEYRFPAGLSGGVMDQFEIDHDDRKSDSSVAINEYTTNLLEGFVTYELSPKISLELYASHYALDHNAVRNRFRNRIDYSAGGALSYALSAKTSLFGQYDLVVIRYEDDSLRNGEERSLSGGWRWDVTGKSVGSIQIGWGEKRFETPDMDNTSDLRVSVQLAHQFTAKTGVSVNAYRRTEESDLADSDYRLAHGIDLGYTQQVRSKLQLALGYSWSVQTYQGGTLADIADKAHAASAAVTYTLRKWCAAGIEYGYSRQISDREAFDYTANEVVLRLTLSL